MLFPAMCTSIDIAIAIGEPPFAKRFACNAAIGDSWSVSGCKHPHNLKRFVSHPPRHLHFNNESIDVARKLLLSGQRSNFKGVVKHRCASTFERPQTARAAYAAAWSFSFVEMNP
jgi:hypothetical protein